MSARARQLVILIGSNLTGKTTVQRNLVTLLNGRSYKTLPSNTPHEITHPSFVRKCRSVFVAGRSYQEFSKYSSVTSYFRKEFDPKSDQADLAFMSSHLNLKDVAEMIKEGQRRLYNVCGLFFSNSIQATPKRSADIAGLPWDERWLAENATTSNSNRQQDQLWQAADTIVQMLISRQLSS